MTIRRLEDFARSIGAAVGFAQKGARRPGPEARVTAMDVDLAATVERLGAADIGAHHPGLKPGALALRIGRPKHQPASFLRLSIGVRGERGEEIEVRLEGRLLGRYGRTGNHGRTANGEKN